VLFLPSHAGTLDVNRSERLMPLINLGHDAPQKWDPTEGEAECQAPYDC
jgi:hypothetical protein